MQPDVRSRRLDDPLSSGDAALDAMHALEAVGVVDGSGAVLAALEALAASAAAAGETAYGEWLVLPDASLRQRLLTNSRFSFLKRVTNLLGRALCDAPPYAALIAAATNDLLVRETRSYEYVARKALLQLLLVLLRPPPAITATANRLTPPPRYARTAPPLVLVEADYNTSGTGRCVWHAAEKLSDLMCGAGGGDEAARLLAPDVVGRRVLEMGCGIGLVGMVAARLGAAEVLMSDADFRPQLLEAADANAAKNGLGNARAVGLDWKAWEAAIVADAAGSTDRQVRSLAERIGLLDGDGRAPPVIVAADCVFGEVPGLSKALYATLDRLLDLGGPDARAYVMVGYPEHRIGIDDWERLVRGGGRLVGESTDFLDGLAAGVKEGTTTNRLYRLGARARALE